MRLEQLNLELHLEEALEEISLAGDKLTQRNYQISGTWGRLYGASGRRLKSTECEQIKKLQLEEVVLLEMLEFPDTWI